MVKVQEHNELMEKIKNIDDPKIINEIYRLLEINFDDTVYRLNKHQEREISQARQEIQRGEGISSEQLDKEIDEWIKK